MVKQYPYELEYFKDEDGYFNDNGSYIEGKPTWVTYCVCRDENGSGKKVTVTDGIQYDYSALIQCPKGVEPLPNGTEIRVVKGIDVRFKATVIHSRKDQLHTRIWAQ